jgi:uncharacterized protein (TIGR03437 family)
MLAVAALAIAIPLHFEPNHGHLQKNVRFSAVARGYTLELSDTAIAMNFRGGSLRLNLPRTKPEGTEKMIGKSSYYLGSDESKWRTGISNFARVRYQDVFPGVDLSIYGRDRKIEYDWIVAPGADPRSIRFSFTGSSKTSINRDGDLLLETAAGEVRHTKPRIYQSGREIPGRFVLEAGAVRFEIGEYDKRLELTIDPVLLVNSSFGGSGIDWNFPGIHEGFRDTGTGIATDSSGNIYITGTTFSTNFPLVNSLQAAPSQSCSFDCEFNSVFVTKLSPDGSTLLYSTYIGVPATVQAQELSMLLPAALAVDSAGTVYLTGATSGVNFPGGATTAGGTDAFLLRLNSQGSLIGVSLFGGSANDAGTSIVLGPDGYVYLAGVTQSPDFPVTKSAYATSLSGTSSVFAIKINFSGLFSPPNGTLIYSTYVGPGTSVSVAADSGSNAYIAVTTTSAAWPTTPSAVQPACAGSSCADIAVAKLDPLGQKLLYATYLGGSQTETLGGIAVDASGDAFLVGSTDSPDFPTTPGVLEAHPTASSNYTGFLTKLSPDATKFIYSTYFGGSGSDQVKAVAVDAQGDAYLAGSTSSADLPLRGAIQSTPVNTLCYQFTPSGSIPINAFNCASAGFLSMLNPTGTGLIWSTYFGSGSVNAISLDAAANVYATGIAISVPASEAVGVLKIGPGASVLDVPANSIVNAASYAPGLPLAGGLASMFVRGLNLSGAIVATGSPLPTQVAGVSILVGGIPAPILAVAPAASGMQQINFQVPFAAASNVVELRYGGSSTFAFPQTAPPGIFTLSDGAAAIQHAADYSLVTPANPAHPGEVIIVYATGLGKVSPVVATGVAPSGPAAVVATCGSSSLVPGTVLYAGLTPGAVGLYQMNVQLPQNLAAGTVAVSIGTPTCTFLPAGYLQSNSINLPVQ